ncbi:hypothetical protein [Klebsiella pneumoniae]|uniref:hypothetical protein n=1 Tax=Klebsiella pneumoniae TaxID=573 RepID=UPI00388F4D90
MGHYTIRTNDDEDQAIKKAQEATGQASASKTFMTAILELQRNRDEMAQLRRELAQEKGVLGIFRPKTTKCSGGPAVCGLQRGITFFEIPIWALFE